MVHAFKQIFMIMNEFPKKKIVETEGKNDDPQRFQMIRISDPPNFSSPKTNP